MSSRGSPAAWRLSYPRCLFRVLDRRQSAPVAWRPDLGSLVRHSRRSSIEAIFLSTFVLIAQNRMATAADKRADLDLQISLLTEHEITKLTTLVSNIAEKFGVSTHREQEIAEIQQDIAPKAILEEIENRSS
jgi:uncharacterized protein DUF1003